MLFIDGDHSYGGVASDFNMYKEFVATNGVIGFHDICMFPETMGDGNEVGVFWNEVSKLYKSRKIIDPNGVCKPVAPKGKNLAFGIGLINSSRQ